MSSCGRAASRPLGRVLEFGDMPLAGLPYDAFVPTAEAMDAMLWLGDAQGKCIYLNKALREFWGIDVADLPRFSWGATLLPEDHDAVFAAVGAAMAERKPFTVCARYRRADGAIRMLETRAEPRFAPNGEFLGMVGMNVDVTEAVVARRDQAGEGPAQLGV
jgi:PAS domain S-box-containing protein